MGGTKFHPKAELVRTSAVGMISLTINDCLYSAFGQGQAGEGGLRHESRGLGRDGKETEDGTGNVAAVGGNGNRAPCLGPSARIVVDFDGVSSQV